MTSLLTAEDFVHLDIPSTVEQHTSTRLYPGRTQCTGACPYDDCPGDTDGFIVFYELSKQGRHFFCRTCHRSGDVVKLLQDIKNVSFSEAKALLEIGQGKPAAPRRQPTQSDRAKKEREFLAGLSRYKQRGLQHARAQAYLAQRAIPLELALVQGMCYIPPYKEMDEETQNSLYHMRQWTDRLIFPLSDGGFTGRALFKWTPGMDEDEHKKILDDYNERIKAHNRQHPSDKKDEIPRWWSTATSGYFHGHVLTSCDHVTPVEGPFDALALLAGGIEDVLAAGTNGIRVQDIPVNVLSATIAFDGDESGKKAAAVHEKIFNRKGIRTRRVVPPDDGKGKDWSARYRLHGVSGLAALLDTTTSHEPSEVAPTEERQNEMPWLALASDILPPCSDCGRNDANTAPIEAEFHYDDDGVFFCEDCWQSRQAPSPTVTYTPDPEQESPPPMEQVLLHIEHIDAICALVRGEIDGPILLREVPPSWSQEEWMKDVAREYEAMYRRGEQAKAHRFLELISRDTRVKAS